jgi:hypothetical protein
VTTGVEADEVAAAVEPLFAITAVVAVAEVMVNAPFGTPVAFETTTTAPTGGAQVAEAKVGRLAVALEIPVKVIVITPTAVVAMPVAETVRVTGPVA